MMLRIFAALLCIFEIVKGDANLALTDKNPIAHFQQSCSRENSRRVRHFVDTTILSKYIKSFNGKIDALPATCKLNPKYDLYLVSFASVILVSVGIG